MNFLSTDLAYLSDQLINHHNLKVGKKIYQLIEIEFYHKSSSHNDTFVHGDQEQLQNATWYYHRMRGGYKEGTYKGMDITFGPNNEHGGLLVRCIKDLSTGNLIEGPCLVVQEILKEHKLDKVSDLAKLGDADTRNVLTNKYHSLVALQQPRTDSLLSSPRVGLKFNSRMAESEFDPKFAYVLKPYRIIHGPSQPKIKKQATTLGIKLKVQSAKTKFDANQVDSTQATKEQLDKFRKSIISQSKDKSLKWNKDFYYKLYQYCFIMDPNWVV